ncbi:polyketide synthase protein [Rutstroemia sp. NJR-2017a BBW]|nr:polyketide synthase protein [Rutstroemia sp. NJR-2017a BBW]
MAKFYQVIRDAMDRTPQAAGMLVMAIEAANQVATTQSDNRAISGFSIKNAHFSRPLIIPTSSEGIEVQFHLRKGASGKYSDSNWSEFVLYAWENDQCVEISRGFVRVEYENTAASIKLALHDHNQVYEEATSASSHQIDQQEFYEALNAKGYEFGRAFQSLDKISSNETGVSANVKVFEGLNSEQQQPHIIHPSTLDGMIHLGLASLFRDGSISGPLAVPTFIEKLWVSKNGLSSRESTTIKAVTVGKQDLKTTSRAAAISEYSGSAVDERETKVLVKIDGLRLSAIESSSEIETSKAEGPMCHSLSWFPDVSLLKGDEILTTCNRLTDVSESTSPSKIPIIQDLETVASIFLARTFQTPIDSYPQEYLKKYALWAERHLNRFQLDSAGGEWLRKLLEDDSASEELFRRVEAATARGKLIVKVGRNLRGILSGEVDPLWLLFGDPENLLLQTYSFFDETSDHWKKFLLYMKLLAHKNPNMDILEIGAGTGATTALVIDTFTQQQGNPQFSRYDFTDISASFFDEAKGRFGVHPGVGFKTLNIESDPGSQGFKDGFYDLIITSNVLHATRDMRATLTNVRRLLKPGGKLVLHEATNIEVLRTGFIFGTLPGWWLSDETFRPWGATMTSKVWQELLVETGFSGIDMMFSDYESGNERESDIMVATASKFPEQQVSSTLQHAPSLSNGSSKEQLDSRSNGNSSIIRNGVVKMPIRKRQMVHLIIDTTSETQSMIARQIQQHCSRQDMDTDTELVCRAYSLSEAAQLDKLDTTPCIFLLEIDRPFLYEMSKEEFADLQHILCSSLGNIWINSAGYSTQITPSYSLVEGMSRAIRSETSAIFITIAFCITNSTLSDSQVDNFFSIFSRVDFGSPDVTYEPMYVEGNGTLNIGRVIEFDSLNKEMAVESSPEETKVQRLDEASALRLFGAGNKTTDSSVSELPTFVVDQEFDKSLEPDEIEMKVHALGLQQKISRSISTQPSIEDFSSLCWSGVVTRLGSTAASQYSVGDEVFMLKKDICKTHLRGNIACTSKLPPGMSFSDAAVLPVDFAIAWQCINGVARLESGESILIHEGTPSLLDAAIRISQHLGAEIFITIPPNAEKTSLVERYGIPEDHIFYSDHDGSFIAALRRLGNQGVDVLLNSSIGESLSASWGLINSYGRFVDITQSAFSTEFELSMDPFKRGATLSSFNCADWMSSKPGQIRRCLQKFVEMSADCDGIFSARNQVETFPISKMNQASALMSKAQFINNVALQLNLSDEVSILSKREPTYSFDSDATYLIAGGLGSIGRATARWMITRGAKNLVLLSRSGAKSGGAQEFLSELSTPGVNIAAPACDITSYSTLRDTLEHLSSKMPPIKGCIQASMVLSDSAFQSMTYSQWQNAASPKTVGSWNLHQLLPSNLDFFILLSSISGIIGMPGQANYAAGNTFVDSLALHRVTQGQKAASIALGVMDEDGYLTNDASLKQSVLASLPATPISRSYYYDLLSHFCDPALKLDKESYNPIVGLRRQTATDTRNFQRAGSVWKTWFQSPLFSMVQNAASDSSSLDVSSSSKSLQELFVQAQTPQEAVTVVLDALVSKIARMSGDIKEEMIEPMSAMHSYGVDSLVAIQIRKWLKREFGADVAVFDILGGGTFFGVAGIVVERSQLLKPKSRGV